MKPSDAIAAKQWRIDIRSMNTMRYGSRIVTPDFYLELRGDTLHSYLPYLGGRLRCLRCSRRRLV